MLGIDIVLGLSRGKSCEGKFDRIIENKIKEVNNKLYMLRRRITDDVRWYIGCQDPDI